MQLQTFATSEIVIRWCETRQESISRESANFGRDVQFSRSGRLEEERRLKRMYLIRAICKKIVIYSVECSWMRIVRLYEKFE